MKNTVVFLPDPPEPGAGGKKKTSKTTKK